MKSFWKADFPRLWWVQLTRGNLSSVGRQGVQRQGIRWEAPLGDTESWEATPELWGPDAHGPPGGGSGVDS